jgi:hypothetical protein
MKTEAYFPDHTLVPWPSPGKLHRHFLPPHDKNWQAGGNDHWGLTIYPLGDNRDPDPRISRRAIRLDLVGVPEYGVFIHWQNSHLGFSENYFSRGDLTKLGKQVRNLQGDARPLGLFVPFATAWLATEDFMLGKGTRSDRIEWIKAEDLPPNTFLVPHEATCIND